MKTNCWLILGTMIATSAVAQVNTNKLPEIPPPATVAPAAPAPVVAPAETKTNAPAKKAVAKKKKAVKKAKAAPKTAVKEAEKKSELPITPVTLVPGAATVAADHVNLRGQAGLKGEVVGHVQKGDSITVISEITLDKPKAGEPAQWAKIALPASAKVWVDSKYIDATNKVVTAKKLNLRGGPGENYSVLGVIEKGTSIAPVTTKDSWTQIETPTSAFAFVAASYLKQEGSVTEPGSVPPPVATTEPVPPAPATAPTPTVVPPPTMPPTPTTVAEQPTIAPPATTPPPTPETAAPTPPPTMPTPELAATTPAPQTPAMSVPAPTTEEDTNLPPPPPRIVTHEGTVRHSVSPVAPTYYELFDPATDKAIDYLYTTSTNLNLTRYNGLHITVTGEEALDVRWQDTPVLTIQKIYVLSGSPKPDATELKPVKKHSWFRN